VVSDICVQAHDAVYANYIIVEAKAYSKPVRQDFRFSDKANSGWRAAQARPLFPIADADRGAVCAAGVSRVDHQVAVELILGVLGFLLRCGQRWYQEGCNSCGNKELFHS